MKQALRFCRCIKGVRKTIRVRPGQSKESAAIAICVKSVLQRRGRTLKKFKCRGGVNPTPLGPVLTTQSIKLSTK